MARRRSRWGGNHEWEGYRPYVTVGERRRLAAEERAQAARDGDKLDPVEIARRQIATTPWGSAWCDHIESFHDFSNRLPRGRTYVRNGSVYHLAITRGKIQARVMGSEPYTQQIEIAPCKPATWKRLRKQCAGGIGSLIELLEGRISEKVMASMTAKGAGLLPDLGHVQLECSCPDWASLCKHLAAVLYGVGARLDERPELLFTLRGVDPAELVDMDALPRKTDRRPSDSRLEGDLSSVFGIDLDEGPEQRDSRARPAKKKRSQKSKHAKTAKAAGTSRSRPASAKPNSRSRARKVTRQELLQAGVPPGTISSWRRSGVLEDSGERGVYRHTRRSRARLKDYSGEQR